MISKAVEPTLSAIPTGVPAFNSFDALATPLKVFA